LKEYIFFKKKYSIIIPSSKARRKQIEDNFFQEYLHKKLSSCPHMNLSKFLAWKKKIDLILI